MARLCFFLMLLTLMSCIPPYGPHGVDRPNIPHNLSDWEVSEWMKAVWTFEHRGTRRDGWVTIQNAQVYVIENQGRGMLCADTPFQTCTLRHSDGFYVIEYDAAVKGGLCHEFMHVLLWESGMGAGQHHEWMKQTHSYICEETFELDIARRRSVHTL